MSTGDGGREAEYRRLFLECAVRIYTETKTPTLDSQVALYAAHHLVDALRVYDDMQAMWGRRAKRRRFDSPSARFAALRHLKAAGLTFAECLQFFGERREENPYARAARDVYAKNSDGLIEVDDKTVVAPSEAGAFVLMWGFVAEEDVPAPSQGTQEATHG
ncbi:hypothetical protein C4901_09060 [Acidiferrobacter sp. SPIII_3]|uniref:hypothetical protein n=1 Tax=Acidiferrobacter sp. SPIII_3 TaxID=1281578 RepID=UPI000D72E518|nr:hypothetical protein [Acidiferrobacter sp. SPIII_3]AWP23460.1 hypothetical protein C4901_09060 [Acidiferrobacter sp. SPIII_3]